MRARQTARGTVAREEMFMMKKLPRTKVARHLEMLVAYQNNLPEEAIFGSNKIEEQHEIMKLENEEVMHTQNLINELNRPAVSA